VQPVSPKHALGAANKPTCAQRVNRLFHQLDAARVSWAEWNESLPNACAFFDAGTDPAKDIYTIHRNPAVYYGDTEGGRYSENFSQAPKPECLHKVIAAGSAPADTAGRSAITACSACWKTGSGYGSICATPPARGRSARSGRAELSQIPSRPILTGGFRCSASRAPWP
jgi:hypothetical protein